MSMSNGSAALLMRKAANFTLALTIKVNNEDIAEKSSQKIIELITEDCTITTQEMANRLGISRRAIAKAIAILQDNGIIRRIGPDKGGHWEIKKTGVKVLEIRKYS